MLEGFAIYLVPLMIGARDLVCPRLGALGCFCYLFGGVIVLSSFLFDAAPDGGWFMCVPLSTSAYTEGVSADFWLIDMTLAEIASITAAVEIIALLACNGKRRILAQSGFLYILRPAPGSWQDSQNRRRLIFKVEPQIL
jgi:cytochrome c oxidase subunit I+III